MHNGEIWIIDDDQDDQVLIQDICRELKLQNKLVFIDSSALAMKKMNEASEAPFIILCDVKLPKMDGFELRAEMLKGNRKAHHSVPFIFWSSVASEIQIKKAYDLSAHGFFIKESSIKDLSESFIQIIEYWQKSKMPDKKEG